MNLLDTDFHDHDTAVNNLCKDDDRDPVAIGDLVARICKGLGASHVSLTPMLVQLSLFEHELLHLVCMSEALRVPTYYILVLLA
jgi:hypothetical protein